MANVLERGNIYFVYRPKVERASAAGLEDIQRFFVILSPFDKARHRLIVIGQKKLPAIRDNHERNWGSSRRSPASQKTSRTSSIA
jgi:hypothetical protein